MCAMRCVVLACAKEAPTVSTLYGKWRGTPISVGRGIPNNLLKPLALKCALSSGVRAWRARQKTRCEAALVITRAALHRLDRPGVWGATAAKMRWLSSTSPT